MRRGWILLTTFTLGCASTSPSKGGGAKADADARKLADMAKVLSGSLMDAELQAMARGPEYELLKLSPDGTTLSVVVQDGEGPGLAFFSVPDLKPQGRLAFAEGLSPNDYVWVSNERVLIGLSETVFGGSAHFDTGQLYAVNKDGTNGSVVYGYSAGQIQTGSSIRKAKAGKGWASIAHGRPDDPREAVIWERPYYTDPRRRDVEMTRLFKLNVMRGTKDLLLVPQGTVQVTFDQAGEPLIAYIPEGDHVVWQVKAPDGRWSPMPAGAEPLHEHVRLVGTASRERFYVIDQVEGKADGLIRVDVATGGKTVVTARAHQAPGIVHFGPKGNLAGVTWLYPYPKLEVLPEAGEYGEHLQRLAQSLPGQTVIPRSTSEDGRYVVVETGADRTPGAWFLYDTVDGKASKVVDVQPSLGAGGKVYSAREAFALKANDDPSLVLTGYLTFPNGGTDARSAPTVVMPHGGPASHDTWFFDYEAQALASFGYLVMQVNFRGSSGFGRAFETRAYGEWGGKVQDDIAQAVEWGIAEGLVDPKRVCIYGGSFGAYSAMMSPIRRPDMFKCASGLAGVYDLEALADDSDIGATDLGRSYLDSAIGHDEAMLKAQSPLHRVAELKVPIQLAHGELDERAPFSGAEAFHDAAKAAGVDVTMMVMKGEGHGFRTTAARIFHWSALREFLDKHLGGGVAAAAPR